MALQKFQSQVKTWWTEVAMSASPPRKSARSASSDLASESEDPAEKPVSRGFLRKALDAQGETLAQVFEEELTAVKQCAETAKTTAEHAHRASVAAHDDIKQLRQDLEAQQAKTAELENKLEEQRASGSAGDAATPGAAPGQRRLSGAPIAPEQLSQEELDIRSRTARIGNLGWDTPADTLVTRAENLMTAAGMAGRYTKLRAAVRRDGTGSGAELLFESAATLDEARSKVQDVAMIQPGQVRPAWLAKKKSRVELAPNRMIGILHQAVREAEQGQQQKAVVERSKVGKCILINGERFFGISEDCVFFVSPKALARYGRDAIDDMCAWAENAGR